MKLLFKILEWIAQFAIVIVKRSTTILAAAMSNISIFCISYLLYSCLDSTSRSLYFIVTPKFFTCTSVVYRLAT